MKYSDTNCQQDYIVVPGGSQTGLDRDRPFSYDRFCGSTLGVCGVKATGQASCQEVIGPVVSKLNTTFCNSPAQHIGLGSLNLFRNGY